MDSCRYLVAASTKIYIRKSKSEPEVAETEEPGSYYAGQFEDADDEEYYSGLDYETDSETETAAETEPNNRKKEDLSGSSFFAFFSRYSESAKRTALAVRSQTGIQRSPPEKKESAMRISDRFEIRSSASAKE